MACQVRSKNEIRRSIKQLFPVRECFALVRPADDEATLRDLDAAHPSAFRQQFRTALSALTRRVFQAAAPKTMAQQVGRVSTAYLKASQIA